MTDKTIPLSRRYEAHGEVFDAVKIREPRFADLMALGEPYQVQRSPAGSPFIVENHETIAAYVRCCVIEPGTEKLGELGVRDTRAVRDAVLGFFTSGEATTASPPLKPESAPTS